MRNGLMFRLALRSSRRGFETVRVSRCGGSLRGAIQPGLPGFVIEEKGCTPGNVAETLMSMGLPSLTLN